VRVEKVKLKDLSVVLEYVGSLSAQEEVLVYPKVSGKIIEKLKDSGDALNKGYHCLHRQDEVGLLMKKRR